MPFAPEKIRNVAFVGHRGSGKTSLAEALLFQAGAVTRLGSVADGTTVSDHDDDEKRRTMSISGSLLHAEYEGYKLNIFDAPGDPSFIADALGALRVVEGALFTVSAVAGVEVMTSRLWRRCDELESARVVFINHLDRDRADFGATLASIQEQLSPRCVAIAIPIGSREGLPRRHRRAAHGRLRGRRRRLARGRARADPGRHGRRGRDLAQRLIEAVVEVSDDLTAKYLEGEEISGDELREALHAEVLRGELFPVACGSATKNEGTHALLDLIVEGVPAPSENFIAARCGDEDVVLSSSESETAVYAFKTVADAHVGRINFVRVFSGTLHSDVQLVNGRTGTKERIGQVLEVQGKDHHPVTELGPGDIGAVPKLKDVVAGDVLAERPMIVQGAPLPQPIVSVAVEPKVRGEDEKMATALRRLSEEDPTLRINRDERTSELLVSGLSQMHVEVTVERVKRRFGVEIVTHPPRVPYFEAIRSKARAHARYKKQTGGRGQFGDCHIEVEPLPAHEGYEFIDKIVGGVIPQGFRPAVDKGIQDTMHTGDLAGYPVIGVRVTLVDGSYHSVDSSEMAFRIAGSMAFKKAYSEADPVLLEPIMSVEITSPSETVGDVIGDLNSRRGRPLGMDPVGANTVIRRRGADVRDALLRSRPDVADRRAGRLRDDAGTLRRSAGARLAAPHRRPATGARSGQGVTQIAKIGVTRQCGVCGRTLLLGEQVEEFTNGVRRVSVCTLCLSEAGRARLAARRRARAAAGRGGRAGGGRAARLAAPAARRRPSSRSRSPSPSARCRCRPRARSSAASTPSTRAPTAARVASIAKSLGVPRASVVVLSGNRPDAIVTVAWEISWYQYRVEAEHGGHVRLEDRGDDPGVIDQRWRDWNAQVAADGQLTLV